MAFKKFNEWCAEQNEIHGLTNSNPNLGHASVEDDELLENQLGQMVDRVLGLIANSEKKDEYIDRFVAELSKQKNEEV